MDVVCIFVFLFLLVLFWGFTLLVWADGEERKCGGAKYLLERSYHLQTHACCGISTLNFIERLSASKLKQSVLK